MNVSAYPHMKRDAAKKFHREVSRKAFPRHLQKEMSFEEFAKKVGMDGRENRD